MEDMALHLEQVVQVQQLLHSAVFPLMLHQAPRPKKRMVRVNKKKTDPKVKNKE
jgi:hypothetical protein